MYNKNVELKREVFSSRELGKVIDKNFSELLPSPPDPTFYDINLATVEDFFELYNKFFYDIDKYGESNSHKYLIDNSSDYINYSSNNEEIQALLDEINALRAENLRLYRENIELITGVPLEEPEEEGDETQPEICDPPTIIIDGGGGSDGNDFNSPEFDEEDNSTNSEREYNLQHSLE